MKDVLLVLTAVVVVLLIVSIVGTTWYEWRTHSARLRAARADERAALARARSAEANEALLDEFADEAWLRSRAMMR